MVSFSHKDLVLKYFKEVFEERNVSILDEIIHSDYTVDHYYGDPKDFGTGIDLLKKRSQKWIDCFKEKFKIIQIMENDEAVFCYYSVTTYQINNWFDKSPKEYTAKVDGFSLFIIKDSKIVCIINKFDYNDFWSQLGYLVDDGQYQYSRDLYFPSDFKEVKFHEEKLHQLEEDYSVLQSSSDQYKDLLQYSRFVKSYLNISEKAMRAISISIVVEWQKETKLFQSDLTGLLPQELLMHTINILEKGRVKLKNMLIDSKDDFKIDIIFDNLIDFFAKEYSR